MRVRVFYNLMDTLVGFMEANTVQDILLRRSNAVSDKVRENHDKKLRGTKLCRLKYSVIETDLKDILFYTMSYSEVLVFNLHILNRYFLFS